MLVGFLTFAFLVASGGGEWPVAAMLTWVLLPLLLLCWKPTPSA